MVVAAKLNCSVSAVVAVAVAVVYKVVGAKKAVWKKSEWARIGSNVDDGTKALMSIRMDVCKRFKWCDDDVSRRGPGRCCFVCLNSAGNAVRILFLRSKKFKKKKIKRKKVYLKRQVWDRESNMWK